MKRKVSDKYLEQARLLDEEATERLFSRMRSKLMRRLEDRKMSGLEAVALQLEIEDACLSEWRERMTELRKND